MNSMEAKRVMNGKYADLYIDGDLMAEATAFKAEVTLTKEEVKMLRHVGKGYKVTGYDCKGQLKLHKVSSYMIKKMNDNIKAGKQTVVTIVSVLDDKDAIGSERIVIKDANNPTWTKQNKPVPSSYECDGGTGCCFRHTYVRRAAWLP